MDLFELLNSRGFVTWVNVFFLPNLSRLQLIYTHLSNRYSCTTLFYRWRPRPKSQADAKTISCFNTKSKCARLNRSVRSTFSGDGLNISPIITDIDVLGNAPMISYFKKSHSTSIMQVFRVPSTSSSKERSCRRCEIINTVAYRYTKLLQSVSI